MRRDERSLILGDLPPLFFPALSVSGSHLLSPASLLFIITLPHGHNSFELQTVDGQRTTAVS